MTPLHHRLLAWAIAGLLCLRVSLFAAAPSGEIILPHSQSPDGSREISLTPSKNPDPSETGGFINIRDAKNGKILHRFDWWNWGRASAIVSAPVPGVPNLGVLWRPDGKCFVIGYAVVRGFMSSRIYAQTKKGWAEVEMPDIFLAVIQKAKVMGENRVIVDKSPGGKGHELAKEWLPDGRLKMFVGYRGVWAAEGDEQEFWITLQITEAEGKSKPKALLKSIELKPL